MKKIPRILDCIFLFTGGIILLFVIFYSFWDTPFPINKVNISERLQSTTGEHLLGTDHYGRDIFSRLVVGGQNSLFICIISLFFGSILGVILGIVASFIRGWTEEIILRSSDILFAFPAMMTAIILSTLYKPSKTHIIIAIAIFNIPIFTHLTYNCLLHIWKQDFILSAKSLGCSRLRIIFSHALPSFSPIFLAQLSTQFSLAILAEAGLSYLQLGEPPPQPSWGKMLYEMQTFSFHNPLLIIIPGACIIVSVVCCNIISDYFQRPLRKNSAPFIS